MPDEWRTTRRVDRKFFWTILCTEHPDYVQAVIRGAQDNRNAYHAERQVRETLLQPAPEWINDLLQDAGFVPQRKLPSRNLTVRI